MDAANEDSQSKEVELIHRINQLLATLKNKLAELAALRKLMNFRERNLGGRFGGSKIKVAMYKALYDQVEQLANDLKAAGNELEWITKSRRTNATRDMMILSVSEEQASAIRTRDQVVEKWCREHGVNKDDLSIEQVIEIRKLPEWQNAT